MLLYTQHTLTLTYVNFGIFLEVVFQGPVAQSIVSLRSSLRGHLIKCFTTFLPNTLKFFVEKMK